MPQFAVLAILQSYLMAKLQNDTTVCNIAIVSSDHNDSDLVSVLVHSNIAHVGVYYRCLLAVFL